MHCANSMHKATEKEEINVTLMRPKVQLTVMARNVPCLLQQEKQTPGQSVFFAEFQINFGNK